MGSCQSRGGSGCCTRILQVGVGLTNHPVSVSRTYRGTSPSICCCSPPVPVFMGGMWLKIRVQSSGEPKKKIVLYFNNSHL